MGMKIFSEGGLDGAQPKPIDENQDSLNSLEPAPQNEFGAPNSAPLAGCNRIDPPTTASEKALMEISVLGGECQ
jgi:hypothetical protein